MAAGVEPPPSLRGVWLRRLAKRRALPGCTPAESAELRARLLAEAELLSRQAPTDLAALRAQLDVYGEDGMGGPDCAAAAAVWQRALHAFPGEADGLTGEIMTWSSRSDRDNIWYIYCSMS